MAKPRAQGRYRIKVFDANRYLEYVSGNEPILRLAPGVATSLKQHVRLSTFCFRSELTLSSGILFLMQVMELGQLLPHTTKLGL